MTLFFYKIFTCLEVLRFLVLNVNDIKMIRRVKITDIDNELGVSTSTASRAFSNEGRISKKTRKTVTELVNKWGYKPNPFAINLPKKKSKNIGLILRSEGRNGQERFKTLVLPGQADAVLGFNDCLALEAVEIITTCDKKRAEESPVIGFADEPVASCMSPKLTTVMPPAEQMGIKAAQQ